MKQERATKRGGIRWVLKGVSTSGSPGFEEESQNLRKPRELKVTHYKGSWEVHLSAGDPKNTAYRSSIALTPEEAENAAIALKKAAKRARRFVPRPENEPSHRPPDAVEGEEAGGLPRLRPGARSGLGANKPKRRKERS